MPGAPLTLLEREEIGLALFENRAVAWAVIVAWAQEGDSIARRYRSD